jgi:hypothetical protein
MQASRNLYTLAALLSIALASCATPQDALQRGAIDTYTSTQTARVVSDCVASSWEGMGHAGETLVRPTANGYSVQLVRFGNVHLLIEVLDKDGGSISKSYKGNSIGAGKLLASVRACQ